MIVGKFAKRLRAEEQRKLTGAEMTTLAVGIAGALIVLFGFGFLSTASLGWFFHSREPHDRQSSLDRH